eukprot:350116-Chlamydomonas_euryale.AAC.2
MPTSGRVGRRRPAAASLANDSRKKTSSASTGVGWFSSLNSPGLQPQSSRLTQRGPLRAPRAAPLWGTHAASPPGRPRTCRASAGCVGRAGTRDNNRQTKG